MMKVVRKTFKFGNETITIETGRIARQAHGAVMITTKDSAILCAVTGSKEPSEQSFFPLSVHYQEKTYAAGKIPGGFFKREGRPSEKETLTSRLIDRPIRPLFPADFAHEVQVVCTVLSVDKEQDTDILALIGTSAALAISGIPFAGPVAAARVGFLEEEGYVLNPTFQQRVSSDLDMVVAGTQDAVLMVESEANELTEDEMLGAILFAHEHYQIAVKAIAEFTEEVGPIAWELVEKQDRSALFEEISAEYHMQIASAYKIGDKQQRYSALKELRQQAVASYCEAAEYSEAEILELFSKLEKQLVRENLLAGKSRIDGRDTKTVRPLAIETGLLPRTHGSALFTRGETQALATCTLGPMRDAQIMETLHSETKESFVLHYNFPPYSVGECGRLGGPGRRELGHGRLARRGIQAMLPDPESFPYAIRVVSEITESNGSSSMASVCGASLALMDAGVPLKAAVAGIAMGLIKEGNRYTVLTDILGDEDHLGDMDFKVAGTDEGITALQMDIKISGITEEIMEAALKQAKVARMHILDQMNQVLAMPRPELNANAPTVTTIKIDPDKIRDLIGKGGATVRGLCEATGADIDIDDQGLVRVFAQDKDSANLALEKIKVITTDVTAGQIYQGKVVRVVDFGAFINILPGKDGLVHISQISNERIQSVSDVLKEGQNVEVVVLEVDQRGRIKLSIKDVAASQNK